MKISELVTHSFENRAEIETSTKCGCFYCFKIFKPSEIEYWSDSDDPKDEDPGGLITDSSIYKGKTAICPNCEYDSVIGNSSGTDITKSTLKELNAYWHRGKTEQST
jgi:hypothetical protein